MAIISFIKKQTQDLPAVYFALVMATGIVSIACHLCKLDWISISFFYLNHINYGMLLLLLIARILLYPAALIGDLSDSSKGAGFLTFVAGSSMLGVQYCLLRQVYAPAVILWVVASIGWLLIIYSFLLIRITQSQKPDLENGLNGGWLLLVVSTQSLSILGTQLATHLFIPLNITLFFTLGLFLIGLFFYLLLIPIIFFRMTFDPMKPQEFTPPYWVLMGGAAITALSGATLIQTLDKAGDYTDWVSTLKSITLLSWIVASWWIPLLALLEVWRHFYKKIPFRYNPANWDTVFTIGMYTVCTFQLSKALQVPFLQILPQIFIYIALLVWLVTFISMLLTWMGKSKQSAHE
jgi:tellurite resistance protein TehA-like permease